MTPEAQASLAARGPARDGFEYVAVVDKDWRLQPLHARCRDPRCPNKPVAALNRTKRTRAGRIDWWWSYCAEHMYGRWVENGQVWCWVLRPEDGGQ